MPNENSTSSTSSAGPVVLITGGEGFLGRALIRELQSGESRDLLCPREIRVLDIQPPSGKKEEGVKRLQGDVCRPDDLTRALAGVDVVFHLAALIDWGQQRPGSVRRVNVEGTRNVIEACVSAGVRSLIYTSSLDAIFPGRRVRDANESFPYPAQFPNEYCSSKAEAEQAVVRANGTALAGSTDTRLKTIVLRPCAIWGEGDPYHVGSFLKLVRLGPVCRMGRERAPYQFVYVGNMAHALVLAARALLEGRAEAAGQIYFIKDFPPRNIFDQMEPVVRAAGGRMLPPALALPRRPLKAIAYVAAGLAKLLRPVYPTTPLLTPFSVDSVCAEYTIVSDKAERLLGYAPVYSESEAWERTLAFVRAGGQAG